MKVPLAFCFLCDTILGGSSCLQTSLQGYGSLTVAGGAGFQLGETRVQELTGSFTDRTSPSPWHSEGWCSGRMWIGLTPITLLSRGGLTSVSLLQPAVGTRPS